MQRVAPDAAPETIYSPRDVQQRTTLSGTTIWRLRQQRKFPEPVELSPGRKGYRQSDIEQWLATRRRA